MLKIIKLILNFLKSLRCKLGYCCGSQCSSECKGAEKAIEPTYDDGSIIPSLHNRPNKYI